MMRSDMAAMRTLRHLLSVFLSAPLFATALAACGPLSPATTAAGEAHPARVVERRVSDAPPPRGAGLLRQAMLQGHRAARADVGLPPLAWDERLAVDALGYAQELARTGRFAHSQQPMGAARQGENLWTGTRGAYGYDEMIGHWVAEKRDFINLPTPNFSRTGRAGDVTHYTQIVWARSTAVGCAMASNARDDFLVCRYSPGGNIVGERAF